MVKQSGSARPLSAAACLLLLAGACDDRAVVVGEWIITRKGADAGPPDTNAAPPLPGPIRGCVTPAPIPRRPITLSPQELAKRLAWFLWRAPLPGDELIRQAMTATDTVAVKALAKTMLGQDRAQLGAMMLARSWLKSDEILSTPTLDPVITPGLRQRMQLETETFTTSLLRDNTSTLTTLLTATRTTTDEQLAPLYGVTAPSSPLMELPPGQRSGVLSHLGMLTARASSPRRGDWVQAALLCMSMPAPPPDANLPPAAPAPGETQRTAMERQLSQRPECKSCHGLLDTGYAFEHYDSLGRYRTTDNGLPVNSVTQVFRNTRNEGMLVQDVPDLGAKLAQDCEVQMCVARTFLQHALGRELVYRSEEDEQSVRELSDAFASSGFQLSDLLLSVTQTGAFLAP